MHVHRGRSIELKTLVFNFRKAIDVAKMNDEPEGFFRKFPVGQCGHTSDMLAQYLIDSGIGPITCVNGTYYGNNWNDKWSHSWLVVDGLIIDITGDQFKYQRRPLKNETPIFIGPMTKYYRLFETRPGEEYEHLGLDPKWSNYHKLKDWYKTILKYLM